MNSNLNLIKHETAPVTSTITYTIEKKSIKKSKFLLISLINVVITIMNGLLNKRRY